MAYTTIDNPEEYFKCVQWTGNSSEPRNKILFVENLPLESFRSKSDILLISPNSTALNSSNVSFKEESFKGLMDNLKPKTSFGGLSEFNKKDESIIVEEENHGRIFEYDPKNNKILWTYINSTPNKNTFFRLMWSRFYDKNPLTNS